MGREIEELARFVAQTQLEEIPRRCGGTRFVLPDTLGVISPAASGRRWAGFASVWPALLAPGD
jgi:hypothetical protein